MLFLGPLLGIAKGSRIIGFEFLIALAESFAFGLGTGLSLGLAYGRGCREPKQIRAWRAIRVRSIFTAGLSYCVVVSIAGIILTVAPLVIFTSNPERMLESPSFMISYMLAYGLIVGLPFVVNRDMAGGLRERDDSP